MSTSIVDLAAAGSIHSLVGLREPGQWLEFYNLETWWKVPPS